MRCLTTKLSAIPILILLFASAHVAARTHKARGPVIAIQPTESTTPLVLLARPGWAQVEGDRGRRRLRLRTEETLTGIEETVSGWVAGGVRRHERGSSIFLVSSEVDSGARLPAVDQTGAFQLRPVLLVHDGRLSGAAWLEGENLKSMAVRYADWTGVDWGPVQTVARPGPGSQTALSGTCLDDGEALLVWSRFDGRDDEIYWSLREGASWTVPARVGADNGEPDITPVLARSGRSAALVWGRLGDGEYSLMSSTFRSGRWRAERTVSAPGAAFPSLVLSNDKLYALYRSASPAGWVVSELDAESRVVRQARVSESVRIRPLLTAFEPTGPVLRWRRPGRSATPRWNLQR